MGIRVSKRIGWGLCDLQTDEDGKIIDSRINKEGYIFDKYDERYSIEGYFQLLEKVYQDSKEDQKKFDIILDYSMMDEMKKSKVQLYDCIRHNSEFGLANILHFVPPIHVGRWTRHDDQIDYYEETINHEQHPRFQLLNRTIYPYDHYIDIESLDKDGFPTKIHFWNRLQMFQTIFEKDVINNNEIKKLEEVFGFATREEFERRIIPAIPNGLILFLKYAKIFTDDKFIFDLRPMIYVYWG